MFLILILILIILLFIYDRKNKHYWLERGVYSPPSKFILGHFNFIQYGGLSVWESTDQFYQKGKQHKMIGLYEMFAPKICLLDPNLIKQITVKDFEYFTDRRTFNNTNPKDKILQSMIVSLKGEKWKAVRNVTTPLFSSGKLKSMFSLIEKEAQNLNDVCHSAMIDGKSINVVELSGKYSLNVIQSCAFGTGGESFQEKPSQLFLELKAMFTANFIFILKFILSNVSPKFFNLLRLSFTTPSQARLNTYMKEKIADRRINGSPRADFIYYMMEAQKEGKQLRDGSCVIDDDAIISQSVLFMFAGFDTVKSNLSFIIYNIAKYPEEQNKLRDELKLLDLDEGIDYNNLQELHYLDAFISETMRIYPTAYITERACTKDYKIPDTDVIIPKGMIVTIPTYSIHHDPSFWEDPEDFRPDRFLNENKNKINSYTFLSFGIGPRSCFGNRFALLEMKLAVAKLLLSFNIQLKPGSSLKISKTFMAYKPDDNGVQVILNSI